MWYILDKNKVAIKADCRTAGEFKWGAGGYGRCTVAKTKVGNKYISTVFLGLNHGFSDKPVLFETMVDDQITKRYYTWAEAELGHMEIVEELIGFIAS